MSNDPLSTSTCTFSKVICFSDKNFLENFSAPFSDNKSRCSSNKEVVFINIFLKYLCTLDPGINIRVHSLTLEISLRGYVLIKGSTHKKVQNSGSGKCFLRDYVYCFCQMFQGLRLFKGLLLFRSLE